MSAKPINRVSSLDCLRSLAILMVLLAHTVLAYGAPRHLAFLQLGGTGVDLFFVLSGWLLGRHLLKELRATGGIDLPRFWCRRWLRTLPAYLAVLAATLIQFRLSNADAGLPLQYLFFGQNYLEMPFLHVSWSLCVEEHFYLLVAPAILIVARHHRLLIPVLFTALILPFACRQLGLYSSIEETHVRFDACAAGVLLAAIHLHCPDAWSKLTRFAAPLFAIAATIYVSFYVICFVQGTQVVSDPGVFAIIFCAFIVFAVSSESIQQRLTFPGCYYIASRSYAIYLLHPEVLALLKRFGGQLPFAVFLLLTCIGSCLVAEILYRCVELPVMNAREYFQITRTGEPAAVSAEVPTVQAHAAT
jgi:peptidoglycan/LPS O-acetylase OafA/YrhL